MIKQVYWQNLSEDGKCQYNPDELQIPQFFQCDQLHSYYYSYVHKIILYRLHNEIGLRVISLRGAQKNRQEVALSKQILNNKNWITQWCPLNSKLAILADNNFSCLELHNGAVKQIYSASIQIPVNLIKWRSNSQIVLVSFGLASTRREFKAIQRQGLSILLQIYPFDQNNILKELNFESSCLIGYLLRIFMIEDQSKKIVKDKIQELYFLNFFQFSQGSLHKLKIGYSFQEQGRPNVRFTRNFVFFYFRYQQYLYRLHKDCKLYRGRLINRATQSNLEMFEESDLVCASFINDKLNLQIFYVDFSRFKSYSQQDSCENNIVLAHHRNRYTLSLKPILQQIRKQEEKVALLRLLLGLQLKEHSHKNFSLFNEALLEIIQKYQILAQKIKISNIQLILDCFSELKNRIVQCELLINKLKPAKDRHQNKKISRYSFNDLDDSEEQRNTNSIKKYQFKFKDQYSEEQIKQIQQNQQSNSDRHYPEPGQQIEKVQNQQQASIETRKLKIQSMIQNIQPFQSREINNSPAQVIEQHRFPLIVGSASENSSKQSLEMINSV